MKIGNILGALGLKLDATTLIKHVATQIGAKALVPIIVDFLNTKLNAAARVALGDQLIAAGTNLKAGKVQAAAQIGGDIIEGVKF